MVTIGHIEKEQLKFIQIFKHRIYKVLLFIYLRDSPPKIKDLSKLMHSTTLYNAIDNCLEMGLISERKGEYNIRLFELTEKGKAIVKKLLEIEEILAGEG